MATYIFVMGMLTIVGLIGIGFILYGAYMCTQRRGSVEGIICFTCGVFTVLLVALLTNGVSP